MRKLFTFVSFFIVSTSFAQQCPIIPLPNEFSRGDGVFRMTEKTPIVVRDPAFQDQANFLQHELLKRTGIPLAIKEVTEKSRSVVIDRLTGNRESVEAYRLNITPNEIRISGAGKEGVFYGIISLLQLLDVADGSKVAIVPSWDITDYPVYAWRGILLDESRAFFGKGTVKFLLDWMAFYKLNRFHWHLTDDPGWRLEIKRYPRLALVGGIGNHNDPLASPAYYTQEDIKEIVAYAKARFIEIVPEIDMPGHAGGANKAYPEYSGGGSMKYPDFTFHPGKEETYQYLANILKEVDVLFPYPLIHLGGDEVHFGNEQWNHDPHVTRLMKDNALSGLKAVEKYFIERMADSVAAIDNGVAFWDEAVSTSFDARTNVMFWWRSEKPEQLKEAFAKGYSVVMTPRIPLYFDYVQDTAQLVGRRLRNSGAYNSLEDVYRFAATRFYGTRDAKYVLGIQGSIWTDRITRPFKLQYMTFPRIGALSEAAWTRDENRKDFAAFSKRVERHLEIYRQSKIYFYNPFNPRENPEPIVPWVRNPK